VREVEVLFGPMPDFELHIRRGIERGTALVVTESDQVLGGVLVSRDGQPQRIQWLAVRPVRRRQGVGAALVGTVLDRWPAGDVEVVTFTVDTPEGGPARRLYERFGFECRGRTEAAPDGSARDLFVLSR
jgi:GNAT superfamily N-acetyltransferase